MGRLILMRHGESAWNQQNLFTGWVDVPLTSKGIEEAIDAGKKLQHEPIDIIYTSMLMRAQETVALVMAFHLEGKTAVFLHPEEGKFAEWGTIYGEKARASLIPIVRAWELNERMYGELQGLNKQETAEKFGKEQVQIWRRSYDKAPPQGESLEICAKRTLPYFQNEIVPYLKEGRNVLISAHGNSLRSIIMGIENLKPEEVVSLEITLGEPLYYRYVNGKFETDLPR